MRRKATPTPNEIDSLSLMGIPPEVRAKAEAELNAKQSAINSGSESPDEIQPAPDRHLPAQGIDAADPALKAQLGIDLPAPDEDRVSWQRDCKSFDYIERLVNDKREKR